APRDRGGQRGRCGSRSLAGRHRCDRGVLRPRRMILLYGLASFLAAALLFTVEPLFARLLLPILGGAPSVWNTSQAFLQLALLAGYGYAHVATARLGVRRQTLLHVGVLLIPLATLPLHLSRASAPPADRSPVPWLLFTMLTTVGPSFLVVSATG